MKKIILFFIIVIFFAFYVEPAGAADGLCGFNPNLRPDCPTGGRIDNPQARKCTDRSQCCTNVCVFPVSQGGITQDSQCAGDAACLQALALVRVKMLGTTAAGFVGHTWYAQSNGDGTFTVVCDNGWYDATFDPVPTSPPACNAACVKDADCNGATGTEGACPVCAGGFCKPNVACNSACVKDSDCSAGDALKDGCTACTGGTCKKPPACNAACDSKDPSACAGAKDGCTVCDPSSNTCKAPPACNSACVKDADCAGATGAEGACPLCTGGVCRPNVACNSTCVKDSDCNAGDALKDGCILCKDNGAGAKSCQKPPACNSACIKDSDCAAGDALKDGCTACMGGTCKKPPACNVACTSSDFCKDATDGCTTCSGGTCKTPACGVACSVPADCEGAKDGCTACEAGICKTPFSTDWCHCDGIEVNSLSSGQKGQITAYAKVESAEQVSRAEIVSQKFTLYKFAGDTVIGTALASGSVPTTVVSSSPTLVRYKSVWNFDVPVLEKGSTYRIGVVANDASTCKPKKTAFNYSSTRTAAQTKTSVMGVTTQKPGYCSWPLVGFFASAAGFCVGTPIPSSAGTNVGIQDDVTPTLSEEKDSIQLNTFTPIEIVQKTCTYVIFKVL